MKKLTQINSDPKQQVIFVLDDQTTFTFYLEYRRNTQGWYFSLTYDTKDFEIDEQRLTNHPNILRQFKNILPFGLMCYLPDGTEPMYIDDFTNNRVQLYILNASDVEEIEDLIIEDSGK